MKTNELFIVFIIFNLKILLYFFPKISFIIFIFDYHLKIDFNLSYPNIYLMYLFLMCLYLFNFLLKYYIKTFI